MTPTELPKYQRVDRSLQERAEILLRRTERFASLVKFKAPTVIIEAERRLIFEAVMALPANLEDIQALEHNKASIQADEQDHLWKTGYYVDAAKDLIGDTDYPSDPKETP